MKRAAVFVSIVFALFIVSIVTAQSGSGYDLSWSTIAGGGGSSSGGGYSLSGTIGQSAADVLNGGSNLLHGGFWAGALNDYRAYLPLIIK